MEQKKDIGQLIKEEVTEQGIGITEFAKRICCKRNNVYDIFRRCNIDISLLKRISKELNKNFFIDLARDPELIQENKESEEEITAQNNVANFFEVIPNILHKLGKSTAIMFFSTNDPRLMDYPTPDFILSDYSITFTIGETLTERFNGRNTSVIETINDIRGNVVELSCNPSRLWVNVNIKIDGKTEEEWYNIMDFAFKTYDEAMSKM